MSSQRQRRMIWPSSEFARLRFRRSANAWTHEWIAPVSIAQGIVMSSEDKPELFPDVTTPVKVSLNRRRFLIGSTVAGIGGVAAATLHDGELGAPAQSYRGSVPWAEGTAVAPPAWR